MFTLPAGHRSKWVTMGLWVVLLVAVFPLVAGLGSVQSDDATDQLPATAESTLVHDVENRIPGTEADQLIVVYHRDGGLVDGDSSAVAQQHATLAKEFDADMPPVPSEDGTALMYSVSKPAGGGDEGTAAFVERVRAVTADLPGGLAAEVTGPAAIGADIDAVFEGIDTTLMLVTVIVVASLLIITYRSPFLWLVPLLTVGAAAFLSMALVRVIAGALDMTVSTQSSSIMIVMVFGAGTDYALLIVARYREQLRRHRDVHDAMRAALRGVGPAILASGSTVALGLGCLFVAEMNDISGVGVIGAIGIVATLLTMLTLFPALLTAVGRKVYWPRVPQLGSTAPAGRDWWRWVFARPMRTASISAVVLGALSLGVAGLSTDLRQADSFTTTPESVTGFATLARAYPGEGGRPMSVATPTDQADEVIAAARSTDGVVSAEAGREGNGWTLVEVVPGAEPDSAEEAAVIARLRADLPAAALVGGEGAERVDIQKASTRDTWLVIPIVLSVVLVVLFLLLRALAASLLVVGAVVLSYLAALGLGTLVFDGVLGFAGAEPTLPVLAFVFLVAFGVDYAIFLVARIAEDREEMGTEVAARRALVAPMVVGLRRWIWWPSRVTDGSGRPDEPGSTDEPVLVGEGRS